MTPAQVKTWLVFVYLKVGVSVIICVRLVDFGLMCVSKCHQVHKSEKKTQKKGLLVTARSSVLQPTHCYMKYLCCVYLYIVMPYSIFLCFKVYFSRNIVPTCIYFQLILCKCFYSQVSVVPVLRIHFKLNYLLTNQKCCQRFFLLKD